ncbi:MAG: hypothetical protein KTR31_36115 [Myxococcales bacterium]|nr:hypothetical protein [Myxococcales bacterium]
MQRPTWEPTEQGIELRDGAILTQRREVEAAWLGEVRCVQAEVLVEGQPDLTLEVDLQDDGWVEIVAPLQSGDWQRQTFTATAPTWFDRMRVTLRHGGGNTPHTVAQVRVADPWGRIEPCDDAAVLQPSGTSCWQGDQCESGRCSPRSAAPEYWSDDPTLAWIKSVCSGCEVDADCLADEICGATWGDGPFFHRECVPSGVATLGEACGADSQCDTGVCCNSRCSECCDATAPCNGTGQCEARALRGLDSTRVIGAVCDVGPRPVGAACSFDEDCPAACVGEPLQVCAEDGRSCRGDLDCADGIPGSCLAVGVRQGTCQ